ncbi:MAG: sensor histidine kinase [Dehalococcoidia bacterium]
MSIRLRLTLLYSAILAVTLAAFAVGVYALLDRNLIRETESTLLHAGQTSGVLGLARLDESNRGALGSLFPGPRGARDAATPPVVPTAPIKIPSRMPTFIPPDTYIQVVDANNTVFAISENLSSAELRLPSPHQGPANRRFERVKLEDQSLLMLVEPLTSGRLAGGSIEVARPLAEVDNTLARLRAVLVVGVVTALLLAGVAGWLLATTVLRPIVRLTQAAHEIGEAQDFSRRVAYQGPRDELGRLAGTFNEMLGRLQAAYGRVQGALESQRRFVADASHELRTPLTTIRGNVELLALQDQGESSEHLEALQDIASEAERMSRLVTDLLVLARADGGQRIRRGPVAMRPLVEEVRRQAGYLSHAVRLELGEFPEATVEGNADYLKQLLLILLDNAIKYSPVGGIVRLEGSRATGKGGSRLRVGVSDEGPGIPPEEQPRIFDRFYRLDPSRHGEGAGLGLSIARWIAAEHQGSLAVVSEPGHGSTFTLSLPLLPDPPLPRQAAEPVAATV